MTTFIPEGRLGNWLFKLAATIAYSRKHGLEYTVPTTSRDAFWCPVYHQHLVNPHYDPSLETVVVKENGFPFQELPFDESWRGKNIVLDGYFQSARYFDWCRDEVLAAFGFNLHYPGCEPLSPWTIKKGWCAVHVRRGDAVLHSHKHFLATREWIEEQMAKFPGFRFCFFSDDLQWCEQSFGHRPDVWFKWPYKVMTGVPWPHNDQRQEVLDLTAGSQCECLIGSASTFAVWMGLLQQNPNARRIFPKQWLVENWEGTTAETWKSVMPTTWERA